jgi:hypothetical protein
MICDRKCGSNCKHFIPVDIRIINFLAETFPDEPVPRQNDGTCELDITAKSRKVGDNCVFPDPEAKIDPND